MGGRTKHDVMYSLLAPFIDSAVKGKIEKLIEQKIVEIFQQSAEQAKRLINQGMEKTRLAKEKAKAQVEKLQDKHPDPIAEGKEKFSQLDQATKPFANLEEGSGVPSTTEAPVGGTDTQIDVNNVPNPASASLEN